MKKLAALLMLLMVLALSASASASVGISLNANEGGVHCEFSVPGEPFVTVAFSTPREEGEFTLYNADGAFSCDIPLPLTYGGRLRVKVLNLKEREIGAATLALPERPAPPAPAPLGTVEKKVGKARDFVSEPIPGGVRYAFSAPGWESISLKYKTAQQSGTMTIYPGEGYLFSGEIALPYTFAATNVYLTVLNKGGVGMGESKTQRGYLLEQKAVQAESGRLRGVTVCIDPGHQAVSKCVSEPKGPGIPGETRGTGGMAQGKVTFRRESIVTLEIAYRLRDELLRQGAAVVMTREKEDTWVSNLGRCEIAEQGGADVMLRLHCNMRSGTTKRGISVYCPLHSEYALAVADKAEYRAMGEALLDAMRSAVGYELSAKTGHVTLTDDYIGNNWAKMPVFLVEMGYMSTPAEDRLLSTEEWQQRLCEGMAEGVYKIARMRGLAETEE